MEWVPTRNRLQLQALQLRGPPGGCMPGQHSCKGGRSARARARCRQAGSLAAGLCQRARGRMRCESHNGAMQGSSRPAKLSRTHCQQLRKLTTPVRPRSKLQEASLSASERHRLTVTYLRTWEHRRCPG